MFSVLVCASKAGLVNVAVYSIFPSLEHVASRTTIVVLTVSVSTCSWFSEQIKKTLYGFLITFLSIQFGNLFGYFFNYINYERTTSENWRTNFLLLGIIYVILAFLLMLISLNSFKLKKNIYYPSSRWGNLKNRNKEKNGNFRK